MTPAESQILDELESLLDAWVDRGTKVQHAVTALLAHVASLGVSNGADLAKVIAVLSACWDQAIKLRASS